MTLLELLIVLTLMGITSVLVVPVFARRALAPESGDRAIVASARRSAIRRAEPLRVRLLANGAWAVTALRDGAVVDSGHVRDSLPDTELLLDALGGCVPAGSAITVGSFDPLTCAYALSASPP